MSLFGSPTGREGHGAGGEARRRGGFVPSETRKALAEVGITLAGPGYGVGYHLSDKPTTSARFPAQTLDGTFTTVEVTWGSDPAKATFSRLY